MALATAPGSSVTPIGPTAVSGSMTPMERRHFGALERRIASGLQTFREVGSSLLEIRDQRLYRETHSSFEAYCAERWSLNRARAYQLIDSARVVATLGDPEELRNEAQARELASLDADEAKAVWVRVEKVSEESERPITASMIRRVRAEFIEHPGTNGVVHAEPTVTDRLVQDITRLGAAYTRWIETKPSAANKRRVTRALKQFSELLTA